MYTVSGGIVAFISALFVLREWKKQGVRNAKALLLVPVLYGFYIMIEGDSSLLVGVGGLLTVMIGQLSIHIRKQSVSNRLTVLLVVVALIQFGVLGFEGEFNLLYWIEVGLRLLTAFISIGLCCGLQRFTDGLFCRTHAGFVGGVGLFFPSSMLMQVCFAPFFIGAILEFIHLLKEHHESRLSPFPVTLIVSPVILQLFVSVGI